MPLPLPAVLAAMSGEPDSWDGGDTAMEPEAEAAAEPGTEPATAPEAAKKPSLSASAPAFTFSPKASTFTMPGGAAAAAVAPPPAAPPAAAARTAAAEDSRPPGAHAGPAPSRRPAGSDATRLCFVAPARGASRHDAFAACRS